MCPTSSESSQFRCPDLLEQTYWLQKKRYVKVTSVQLFFGYVVFDYVSSYFMIMIFRIRDVQYWKRLIIIWNVYSFVTILEIKIKNRKRDDDLVGHFFYSISDILRDQETKRSLRVKVLGASRKSESQETYTSQVWETQESESENDVNVSMNWLMIFFENPEEWDSAQKKLCRKKNRSNDRTHNLIATRNHVLTTSLIVWFCSNWNQCVHYSTFAYHLTYVSVIRKSVSDVMQNVSYVYPFPTFDGGQFGVCSRIIVQSQCSDFWPVHMSDGKRCPLIVFSPQRHPRQRADVSRVIRWSSLTWESSCQDLDSKRELRKLRHCKSLNDRDKLTSRCLPISLRWDSAKRAVACVQKPRTHGSESSQRKDVRYEITTRYDTYSKSFRTISHLMKDVMKMHEVSRSWEDSRHVEVCVRHSLTGDTRRSDAGSFADWSFCHGRRAEVLVLTLWTRIFFKTFSSRHVVDSKYELFAFVVEDLWKMTDVKDMTLKELRRWNTIPTVMLTSNIKC